MLVKGNCVVKQNQKQNHHYLIFANLTLPFLLAKPGK